MDLATVDHLLTTTRVVRRRLDLSRPVEPEVLERCIEIALQAPTGSNAQGWHFVVVTDADKRAALAGLYRRGFDLLADAYASGLPYPEGDLRARQFPRMYPRSTPQNRPYVDGSKPANGVGGVETRLGTTACGPPTARCGGWAVRRESKSPHAVVRRVVVPRPARGCNGLWRCRASSAGRNAAHPAASAV